MYLLAEASADVECSVDAAFTYLINMENFSDWFPAVIAIVSANDLPHGQVGKLYRETVSIPLRGIRDITLAVVESEAGRFFATEGAFSPLLPRMEITFASAVTDRCQLHWRMLSRNQGTLARLSVLPLARQVMTKRAKVGMRRLARRLEGRHTMAQTL